MKDCPRCNAYVDGIRCTSCGFSEGGSKVVEADPMRHFCSDVFRGQRCGRLGTVSHGTTGGGQWLCWQHFSGNKPHERVAPPYGFRHFKQIIDPELMAERAAIAAGGA